MFLLSRVPPKGRYALVTAASLIASVYGVYYAVIHHHPEIAGRGGAVGTAIAFLALIARPDYGFQIYERRIETIPPGLTAIEQLEERVAALEAALVTNSPGQQFQNYTIAIATIIGAMFAGFGEMIARWFI